VFEHFLWRERRNSRKVEHGFQVGVDGGLTIACAGATWHYLNPRSYLRGAINSPLAAPPRSMATFLLDNRASRRGQTT
jgi:hypothetical protein